MYEITSRQWLHPVPFLVLTITVPLVLFLIMHFPGLLPSVIYFGYMAVFILPFVLLSVKDISFERYKIICSPHRIQIVTWAIFYLALFATRLSQFDSITYQALRQQTPGWLFWSCVLSWLAGYKIIHHLLEDKKYGWMGLLALLELLVLVITGQRLWIVMFAIGLILMFHIFVKPLGYRWFFLGIVVFILLVGPLTVIVRYSIVQETNRMEVFKKEMVLYPEKTRHTIRRISQKGLVLSTLSKELANGTFDGIQRSPSILLEDIKTAAVPNILKDQKHKLKPGVEVNNTFNGSSTPTLISFPNGIIGDVVWHFGWWSFLILPVISSLMVVLWNGLIAEICNRFGITAIHFSYFFIYFDTHLVFLSTAWIRAVIIYGSFLILTAIIEYNLLNIWTAKK